MKLSVNARNGKYDILIGENLINGKIIEKVQNYAVISDKNVFSSYGHIFDKKKCFIMEPGERSKSFNNFEEIAQWLLRQNINRNDVIIALGGGVVGDIAGFAASVFKRGVRLVQIPTTLLAQVDSSVGGKTAINLRGGKNMVGSFYQPEMVLIDTKTLATLDGRQYAAGMAEIIKYAYIADADLHNCLHSREYDIEKVIYGCCEIKAGIVEQDPYDTGIRMILNYGHTIGHGIETATKYKQYLHGEAVAIGMVYAAKLGEALGVSPRGLAADTRKLVSLYGLPDEVGPSVLADALEAVGNDKKAENGNINFVLIDKIGHAVLKKIGIGKIKRVLGEN